MMRQEITYASRLLDPTVLDQGRFWGLAFARSGGKVAYVSHDLGFCQILESDLAGRERRPLVSLGENEVISEVHGYGTGDRYLVYSVQARGRHEIRVADVASRNAITVSFESFFGGFDDAHDAFFVWDRMTGSRRVMRVTVTGKATLVDAGHIDRRIARSEDGRTVWFAEKFVDDHADKRFTLYRAADKSARVPVAMLATTCRTPKLKLELSPEGRYLHVSALGVMEETNEAIAFDLVVATDGSHRRLLPVKGWVAGDRAIVQARGKHLDLVEVKSGARRPFITESVDQFTVSRDGERVLFTSQGALHLAYVPE